MVNFKKTILLSDNKGRLRINDLSAGIKILESNNRLFCSDNEIFNDPGILLDRANIVYNWLTGSRNNNSYIFIN